MNAKVRHCGLLALAALFGCTSLAFAQADRPYQGLFGEASAGTGGDKASLMLTIAEAYDQDVLGAGPQLVPTTPQANMLVTRLAADFGYRANGRNVQLASTAGANFRYYSDQGKVSGVAHHAGIGVSANVSRTTSLLINSTVAYSPSYLYRLFASATPPEPGQTNVASNYGVNDSPSYSYATGMTVTQQLGRRSRVLMAVGGHYTDYVGTTSIADDDVPLRDLTAYETGATFIRDAGRGHVNVGYTFRRAQYLGAPATAHGLNIGFDYDRPLSATRRTQLKFSVGSVMLQALAAGTSQGDLRQRYQVSGDMALSRQFGRTWQATGAYRRSVGFMEGFSSPVLIDGVTVSTTGRVTQRVDLLMTGAYSIGEPAVASAAASDGFTSYTGNVRSRVALSRLLAVYGEYLYYFYDFSRSVLLPVGAPPMMSRNSAHLGLTVYIPMGRR